MPQYFTTSRKPSQLTRRVTRLFARLLQGEYENRGKRGGEEVLERAERAGFKTACFIYENKGNPTALQFFGKQGWNAKEIRVSGVREYEKTRRAPKDLRVEARDEEGKGMAKLLELEESAPEDAPERQVVTVELREGSILLSAGGKPALELKARLHATPQRV